MSSINNLTIYTADDYKGLFNLKQMEKQYIKFALKKHGNNRSRAAKDLQITPLSLSHRIIRHGLNKNQ